MNYFKTLVVLSLTITITSCGERQDKGKNEVASEVEEALSVRNMEVPLTETASIAKTLLGRPEYASMVKGLKSTDLMSPLDEGDSLTVFASSNTAFEKLPDGMVADLMGTAGMEDMDAILKYHVIQGMYDQDRLLADMDAKGDSMEIGTMAGKNITIFLEDGALFLLDETGKKGKIGKPNIKASNGIVHGIDEVLLPKF